MRRELLLRAIGNALMLFAFAPTRAAALLLIAVLFFCIIAAIGLE
jgi:hypothetical protein